MEIAGGKVRFQLHGDNALETNTAFNDGNWHHGMTSVGEGGQRLRVDGKLIGTGKLTRRIKTSNRLGLDIGSGAERGIVSIDEVQILGWKMGAGK